MIAIVATIQIRPEMVETFEAVSLELERQVAAHEPGCVVYRMARSRADPLTYRSLEIFRDQEALNAHVAAGYFVTAAKAMRPCTSAESVVEFGDTLGET